MCERVCVCTDTQCMTDMPHTPYSLAPLFALYSPPTHHLFTTNPFSPLTYHPFPPPPYPCPICSLQVSTAEIEAKANEEDFMYIETSAKEGHNIKLLFRRLATALPSLEVPPLPRPLPPPPLPRPLSPP